MFILALDFIFYFIKKKNIFSVSFTHYLTYSLMMVEVNILMSIGLNIFLETYFRS